MDKSEERVKFAAVSLIERTDGRMLCVWNKRYEGWSLPGGMVEDGETTWDGQKRELREETGLETAAAMIVFEGEHGIETADKRGRASRVCLFRVSPRGEPRQMEEGCPIAWKTRTEFLAESPFASFYARVFEVVPPRMSTGRVERVRVWLASSRPMLTWAPVWDGRVLARHGWTIGRQPMGEYTACGRHLQLPTTFADSSGIHDCERCRDVAAQPLVELIESELTGEREAQGGVQLALDEAVAMRDALGQKAAQLQGKINAALFELDTVRLALKWVIDHAPRFDDHDQAHAKMAMAKLADTLAALKGVPPEERGPSGD